MKKLITIFLMLVCVLSYAASPGKIIRVLNATTAYGEDVSIGNLIVNTATGEVYVAKLGMASTVTLTSATINVDIQKINNLTRQDIEAIIPITPESSNILNTNIDSNLKTSVSGNTTITIQNLTEGRTGNIEITYSGAAVLTFNVGSSNTLKMSSTIYNTTTNAYTKSVKSQSIGTAVYSYYVSGTNVYLTGTQEWN